MGRELHPEAQYASIPLVVDTSRFSEQDFELFLESSEIIERSQGKRKTSRKSGSNRSFTSSNREELFEVSEVDDNEFLEIASSACNNIDVSIRNLSADIEKLFNDLVEEDDVCKDSEAKKLRQRKIVERKGAHAKRLLAKRDIQEKSSVDKPVPEQRVENYRPTPKISVIVSSTPNTKHHEVKSEVKIRMQQFTTNSNQAVSQSISSQVKVSGVKERVSFFNQLSRNFSVTRTEFSIISKKSFEKPAAVYRSIVMEEKPKTLVKEPECIPCEQNFVKNRIKQFELARETGNRADHTSDITHRNSLESLISMSNGRFVSKVRSYFEKNQDGLVQSTRNDTRNESQSTIRCENKCGISEDVKRITSVKSQQICAKSESKCEINTNKGVPTNLKKKSNCEELALKFDKYRNQSEDPKNSHRVTSAISQPNSRGPAKHSKYHENCKVQPKTLYNAKEKVSAIFTKKTCDYSKNLAKPESQSKLGSRSRESTLLDLRKKLCQDPVKHEVCKILPKTKYNSKENVPPPSRSNPSNRQPNPLHLAASKATGDTQYDPQEGTSTNFQKKVPSCTSLSSATSLPSCVRTVDYIKSGSTSAASSSKTTPEKYNPFIESEKSLKKLADIVRTIRKARDQGMPEVSRDLFHMFKESLKAANSKLCHSKYNATTTPNQRIALVKPTVTSPKFSRALDAISKARKIKEAAKKPSGRLHPYKVNVELTDESELTYEG